MRKSWLVAALMVLGTGAVAPLSAQSGIAQVRVTATLRVPEILRLEPGHTQTIRDGDEIVTRVVVYVTANRAWQLTAVLNGEFAEARLGTDSGRGANVADGLVLSGGSGTRIPVVLEYRRAAAAEAPDLQWMLGAA